jgi:hypothetical protein
MSANDDETTQGGSRILRHKTRGPSEKIAVIDDTRADAVKAHMAKLGTSTQVFHEIVSDWVHLDVHMIPPTEDEPLWTLFTTGMSDLPMNLPADVTLPDRAELILRLPGDWPVEQDAFAIEEHYWPIRWLKILARLPHEYNSWLGPWHTIPNGDPPRPFAANTGQACMMLVPPTCFDDGEDVVATPKGPVALLSLLPLYVEEMKLKLDHGARALLERLNAAGIDDVVAPDRLNIALAPAPAPPPRQNKKQKKR